MNEEIGMKIIQKLSFKYDDSFQKRTSETKSCKTKLKIKKERENE